MMQNKTEYWLQGPLPNIAPLLQPIAHALLQAEAEIADAVQNITGDELWQTPAGVASPAFHLQHIAGVLDRLFTYAKGNLLSEHQLNFLSKEGRQDDLIEITLLLQNLHQQIKISIEELQNINPETLTETRYVGRKKIPSTVMGLLFHAAEHTARHTGQLLVTVKIIVNKKKADISFPLTNPSI